MVTAVIVAIDEIFDLSLEVDGRIVVLQQDPVLLGLMPAFDLLLGLGMVGSTSNVHHVSTVEP